MFKVPEIDVKSTLYEPRPSGTCLFAPCSGTGKKCAGQSTIQPCVIRALTYE
jgi:hypothetical protein